MPQASLERIDGIAVITIDNPPVNAMSPGVPGALLARLAEANADAGIGAVVLRGGGAGTIAGADIRMFGKPWPEGEPTLRDAIAGLEASGKPVVAVVQGQFLGGGLELALACHYRVAAASARLGQPEVKLGFPPGAGGTQRLPRLIGAAAALEMIVSGDAIAAPQAQKLGLIDRMIEGDVIAGALAFARERLHAGGPHPRARDKKVRVELPDLFDKAREEVRKKMRGMQAPLVCIDCVEIASRLSFDDGIRFERQAFEQCVASEESMALRHIFFAERAAAKVPGIDKTVTPIAIGRAAVIGSGTMGSGIAMCFADAGIPVHLLDADKAALERGLGNIRRNYEVSAAKGRLKPGDVEKRMALILPVTDFAALAEADIAIEAVFEEMPVKLEVFKRLDAALKPGAILASNTSYLDVNAIADSLPDRKGYVLGLHFFSPANVMRLLEVVRTSSVSPQVLMSALALGKRLRKLPVVAGVCHGFIGNRMLEGYLRQAQFLLEEGASPEQVDKALTTFGMAMGPFAVMDLAGLDIGWRMRKAFAHRLDPAMRSTKLADTLVELGRLGQKSGAGYYRYEAGSRVPHPDPLVEELIARTAAEAGIVRRSIGNDEIIERCLYSLVNEGARILDEGIALRASDIDLVWTNGYGFPAWRGGPMHWADSVGLKTVLRAIEHYGRSHDYFEPAALLQKLVADARTFADIDAKENADA